MGYLCTTDDGRYALEDADGMVVLDLEEAVPGEGIFTEGCIILVEGIYKRNETLRVFAIGHPPSEVRADARAMYGHVDFLGTGAITIKEEVSRSPAHADLLTFTHTSNTANLERI